MIYIENISNIKCDNNYSNISFNYSLNTQNNNTNQRKRLKPAEALTKSPLIKWNEPIEEWRALVTEDILDHTDHVIDSNEQLSKNYETPTRRYTLNVFDMKNKYNSNTEKQQIHRNRLSLNSNNKRDSSKVSNSWILAKNKIIESTTTYMKSGPGFGPDFGFVSIQELVKVRVLRDTKKKCIYIYI